MGRCPKTPCLHGFFRVHECVRLCCHQCLFFLVEDEFSVDLQQNNCAFRLTSAVGAGSWSLGLLPSVCYVELGWETNRSYWLSYNGDLLAQVPSYFCPSTPPDRGRGGQLSRDSRVTPLTSAVFLPVLICGHACQIPLFIP